jgi:hypothetical protein
MDSGSVEGTVESASSAELEATVRLHLQKRTGGNANGRGAKAGDQTCGPERAGSLDAWPGDDINTDQ